MRHVLIHNIGHSIPLLRRPRSTQGYRADDDDDSDYCKQVVGKNHWCRMYWLICWIAKIIVQNVKGGSPCGDLSRTKWQRLVFLPSASVFLSVSFYIYSFTCHWHCVILAVGSIIKWNISKRTAPSVFPVTLWWPVRGVKLQLVLYLRAMWKWGLVATWHSIRCGT